MQAAHHPSPITHRPSPITHHPSPIPITHRPSPITHHPSVTHHPSPIPITHRPSPVTHHPSAHLPCVTLLSGDLSCRSSRGGFPPCFATVSCHHFESNRSSRSISVYPIRSSIIGRKSASITAILSSDSPSRRAQPDLASRESRVASRESCVVSRESCVARARVVNRKS